MRAFFLSLVLLAPSIGAASSDPTWWATYGVIDPSKSHEPALNFAPANLGQLKQFARAAGARLDEVYANDGGAGTAINDLLASPPFQIPQTSAQLSFNYAPVTLGQIKRIASVFYARLRQEDYNLRTCFAGKGLPPTWPADVPWDPNTPVSQNLLVANVGQLKMAFCFDPENESIYTGTRKIIYVDKSVMTEGDGSSRVAAFKTIRSAKNKAQPGDKIAIYPGIYREAIELDASHSGQPDKPIVYEGRGNVIVCGTDWISQGWQAVSGQDGIFVTDQYTVDLGRQTMFESLFSRGDYLRYQEIVAVNHPASNDSETDPAGRMLLRRTSLDDLRNQLWTFYIAPATADTSEKLYVHFPAGFHPSTLSIANSTPLHIEATNARRTAVLNAASGVHDLTFRGIRFTNTSWAAMGAGVIFQGDENGTRSATNWVFENCTFEGGNSFGVSASGVKDVTFRGCIFTRNGQGGLAANNFENLNVQNCEFTFNSWKGFNENDTNGTKMFGGVNASDTAIFNNCLSGFNIGSGLWFDTAITNIKITNSEFFGNYSSARDQNGNGLAFEVCGGPVEIANNLIYSNCYNGILLSNTGVYHPVVPIPNPELNKTTYTYIFSKNRYADQYYKKAYISLPRGTDPDVNGYSNPGAHYSLWPNEIASDDGLDEGARNLPGRGKTFPRILVPSHKIFCGNTSDSSSDALIANSPTKSYDEYLDVGSGTHTLEIPVFSRSQIIRDGDSKWHCQIYDCYEKSKVLTAVTSQEYLLLSRLPTVPLTRPIYLWVQASSPSGELSLVRNENQPAMPSPTPDW